MSTEPTTPAPEVKGPETTVQTTPEQTPEVTPTPAPSEPKMSDIIGERKVEQVPIARLNKEINRKKELEAEVAALQQKLADGAKINPNIATDLKALAEEHNVDPDFLEKLVTTIKTRAESDIEDKLRPFTEREAKDKQDKAFTEHFSKTLESMPEFKDIVNPTVIKQMALNPDNAEKTFSQLIEEAYGSVVPGKRTIENNTPRGGGTTEPLDIARASKDTEYYKQVMANPVLKAQYNQDITSRVKL